jgi:hypothetical protein
VIVDVELLIYSLLSGRFPQARVTDAPDADAVNNLPLIVYAAADGNRIANAPLGAGEAWVIALSVVHSDRVAAKDLALEVSAYMAELYRTGAGIPGVGYFSYLDETSLFARATQTSVTADDAHQYNAVYTALVRN